MTATVTPRPSSRPTRAEPADPTQPERPARPASADPAANERLVAESALVGLTVVTALGFSRLFVDWGFLPKVAFVALASHALAIATRRLTRSAVAATLISAGAMAVVLGLVFFPGATTLGIPTRETWDAATAALREGWRDFQVVRAPVADETGFLLPAAAALWVAAFLADSFAFRVRAGVEAIVPTATVFAFVSALAANKYRFPSAVAYLAAAVFMVAAHRAWTNTHDSTGWLASDRRRVLPSVMKVAAGLAAVAVVAGVLVGPALPGAGDTELVDFRGRGSGPGTRVTVSPLVDIRSRLATRSETIAFTVESPRGAYWRLTALDTFDGTIWRSESNYSRVSGRLPGSPAGSELVEQRFEIATLESIWLPAAYAPAEINGVSASYDPASASLITRSGTADDQTYSVRSAFPAPSPAALAAAEGPIPTEIASTMLQMPSNFPGRLTRTAQQITRNARTRYDKALALQAFFRDNFTYSLDVQPGHGTDAISNFLTTRRGYCEQFAGTFAAFARALGIPARVAVGFTPGTQDGVSYTVRDRHAHAWPEVWFSGIGWVAFEPTPGRGAPGAESYTNVVPAQDDATVNGSPTTAPTGTNPGAPVDEPPVDPFLDPGLDSGSPLAVGGGKQSRDSTWFARLLVVMGAVVFAVVAWLAAVVIARKVRRSRRRRNARSPSDQVLVAWTEATEALALAGVAPQPSDTHHDFAGRAAAATGVNAELLGGFASLADAAAYSDLELDERAVARAEKVRALIYTSQVEEAPLRRRLRFVLDPRL